MYMHEEIFSKVTSLFFSSEFVIAACFYCLCCEENYSVTHKKTDIFLKLFYEVVITMSSAFHVCNWLRYRHQWNLRQILHILHCSNQTKNEIIVHNTTSVFWKCRKFLVQSFTKPLPKTSRNLHNRAGSYQELHQKLTKLVWSPQFKVVPGAHQLLCALEASEEDDI